MTDDVGAIPERVTVEPRTARRLVDAQFPQWSHLALRPVTFSGWDNSTFRLGRYMVVRLPTAAEYAWSVEKEQRWLPRLAPHVSLPIPSVLGAGLPAEDYPFPWSVYGWIDGERATPESLADPTQFASDLADFLASLRAVDAEGGPLPGDHNWNRGASLSRFDTAVEGSLEALAGHINVRRARRVWERARSASWDGRHQWFHGDLSPANLLQTGGQLSAVIDFGACGVGDPACDLGAVWAMLTKEGRTVFREHLPVDDAEWARGQGWALWNALWRLAEHVNAAPRDDGDASLRVVEAILESRRH